MWYCVKVSHGPRKTTREYAVPLDTVEGEHLTAVCWRTRAAFSFGRALQHHTRSEIAGLFTKLIFRLRYTDAAGCPAATEDKRTTISTCVRGSQTLEEGATITRSAPAVEFLHRQRQVLGLLIMTWVCSRKFAGELFDRPGAPFRFKVRLLQAEVMEAQLLRLHDTPGIGCPAYW